MLSQTLKQALARATKEVFHQHLLTDKFLGSDAKALQSVADEITETVHTALSSSLRELNKENMLFSKFPSELWCRIWEHLTTDECLTVTHVCQDWRRTAGSCPPLWTQLKFLLQHTYDGQEAIIISTSLDRLSLYMERNAHLPFDIEITVEGDGERDAEDDEEDKLREFGSFIAQCSVRIRRLRITTERMDCIPDLIAQFSNLPLLKSLELDFAYGYDELELDVNLPSLEELRLEGHELKISKTKFRICAPSLRTLFARPHEDKDVIVLLQSMPTVQDLSLAFWSSFQMSKRSSAKIRHLLPKDLKSLHLEEMWDDLIVPAFYRADIPALSMQLALMETTTEPTVPSTLRDVQSPTELCCRADFEEDEFALLGPSKTRTIRVGRLDEDSTRDPEAFPHNLWRFLAPDAVKSLVKITVFARLLKDVFPPLSGNSILELVINVGNSPDGEDFLVDWLDDNQDPPKPLFPMLDHLTLDNEWDWTQWQLKISMSSLAAKLAAALSIPRDRPLGQLLLRRSGVFPVYGNDRELDWKVLASKVRYE
ncbi:hypothetical protein BKA62DRAFT_698834 [Auriculariales sp. MPI-PUGE-AT-0066]|nr:hypothetical protein BKA62DRAFT_698834 [Auriculariales sp. MPI-PUGE-AT-0066]